MRLVFGQFLKSRDRASIGALLIKQLLSLQKSLFESLPPLVLGGRQVVLAVFEDSIGGNDDVAEDFGLRGFRLVLIHYKIKLVFFLPSG